MLSHACRGLERYSLIRVRPKIPTILLIIVNSNKAERLYAIGHSERPAECDFLLAEILSILAPLRRPAVIRPRDGNLSRQIA
jgi:hypothetical protein